MVVSGANISPSTSQGNTKHLPVNRPPLSWVQTSSGTTPGSAVPTDSDPCLQPDPAHPQSPASQSCWGARWSGSERLGSPPQGCCQVSASEVSLKQSQRPQRPGQTAWARGSGDPVPERCQKNAPRRTPGCRGPWLTPGGRAGRRGRQPEEGAAQTRPGGEPRAGVVGACELRLAVLGLGDIARGGESPAPRPGRGTQPTRAAPDGFSQHARAPVQAAARPLCAWRVTRGRSRRRARERPPAPRAPFQAQQRPRRGPALTHFPSRLLGPRPRIQRPPPSSPTDLWLGSRC
ncbi:uncharacterized protein LOC111528817 [Piliocolobus tephrosceles]|uniref:uncharacterized protein LOC111528817 n=1 Tax=Piliocolobus tephrosceles TaxID=591936 RepID=UPI000C2A14AD|nr:uncharacterized protein LOC111528817 [Piliocolobus tephrosceles]